MKGPSISHSPRTTDVGAKSCSITQACQLDKGAASIVSLSTRNKTLAITLTRETDTELSEPQFHTKETLVFLKATILSLQSTAD